MYDVRSWYTRGSNIKLSPQFTIVVDRGNSMLHRVLFYCTLCIMMTSHYISILVSKNGMVAKPTSCLS